MVKKFSYHENSQVVAQAAERDRVFLPLTVILAEDWTAEISCRPFQLGFSDNPIIFC